MDSEEYDEFEIEFNKMSKFFYLKLLNKKCMICLKLFIHIPRHFDLYICVVIYY